MLVRVKSAFLWAVCCFSSFSFAAWDGTAEVPSARDTVIFYDYEDFFMKDLDNETTKNKNSMLHGTYDRR